MFVKLFDDCECYRIERGEEDGYSIDYSFCAKHRPRPSRVTIQDKHQKALDYIFGTGVYEARENNG